MKMVGLMFGSLTLLACAAVLGGCASIISGTTQEMSFQTSPDAVVVTLIRHVPEELYWPDKNGRGTPIKKPAREESRILGTTPFTLQLDKAKDQTVAFSKEGYKPVTIKLATRLDGWFWGNIVFGGLVGSTTDSMSGAVHEYSPSQFFVTLNPEQSTPIELSTRQPQRDKTLVFIVRRYTSLMADLSKGSGEDWSALKGLLHLGQGQEADARQKIQALAMVYPDIAVFATHVTDLYLK
jgi:hypothetical protein